MIFLLAKENERKKPNCIKTNSCALTGTTFTKCFFAAFRAAKKHLVILIRTGTNQAQPKEVAAAIRVVVATARIRTVTRTAAPTTTAADAD